MPLPDVSHEWKERRWHYSLLVHNPWGTTRAVARPAAAHVSDAGEFRAGGLVWEPDRCGCIPRIARPSSRLGVLTRSIRPAPRGGRGAASGSCYAIEVSVRAPNVPYGDSFYTHGRYCFCFESATTCRMTCNFEVVFVKATIVRRTRAVGGAAQGRRALTSPRAARDVCVCTCTYVVPRTSGHQPRRHERCALLPGHAGGALARGHRASTTASQSWPRRGVHGGRDRRGTHCVGGIAHRHAGCVNQRCPRP